MATGKVAWFNQQKGYGFIKTEQAQIYITRQEVKETPGGVIQAGQEVEFDIEPGHHGLRAKDVVLL